MLKVGVQCQMAGGLRLSQDSRSGSACLVMDSMAINATIKHELLSMPGKMLIFYGYDGKKKSPFTSMKNYSLTSMIMEIIYGFPSQSYINTQAHTHKSISPMVASKFPAFGLSCQEVFHNRHSPELSLRVCVDLVVVKGWWHCIQHLPTWDTDMFAEHV